MLNEIKINNTNEGITDKQVGDEHNKIIHPAPTYNSYQSKSETDQGRDKTCNQPISMKHPWLDQLSHHIAPKLSVPRGNQRTFATG
jgi:hypothetical protein